jgi:hypothetical protein
VTTGLSIEIGPDALEAIALRVAELLAERASSSAEPDGWLRGAQAIADYLGAPRSRVYDLSHRGNSGLPVHHDGSTLIAKRSELDTWVTTNGGT